MPQMNFDWILLFEETLPRKGFELFLYFLLAFFLHFSIYLLIEKIFNFYCKFIGSTAEATS